MSTITHKDIQHNTELLIQASRRGDVDIVKLLIPVSDPKASNSLSLRRAVINGYIGIVELLIPVSDPKAENSQALQNAVIFGYTDIVKLLIPHSDYNCVLMDTSLSKAEHQLLKHCVEEYEVLKQKDRLHNSLTETVEVKTNSVKRKM